MSEITTGQILQSGLQNHQAGELKGAELLYREVLARDPENAGALHLLGLLLGQTARTDAALEYIRRAIASDPLTAKYHSDLASFLNVAKRFDEALTAAQDAVALQPDLVQGYTTMGSALRALGRHNESVAAYQEALRLQPDNALAHYNLGNVYHQLSQYEQAVAAYRAALRHKPDLAEAHYNLGKAFNALGRLDEAADSYRAAIRLRPAHAMAHNNLGNALQAKGRFEEAVASLRQAIKLAPQNPEIYNNLGNALTHMRQSNDALAAFKQAIRLKPDDAEAYNNLAVLLKETGKLEEAIASYRKAIQLQSTLAKAHYNLGIALLNAGQPDDAIASHRRAVELAPQNHVFHSTLLLALNYCCTDPKIMCEEARRWSRQHAEKLENLAQPHLNNRDPDRPLRIGYVSADFKSHSAQYFIEPLLASHDQAQFEVFCYAEVVRPDAVTAHFQKLASHWRSTIGHSDAAVADLIRHDNIDILIDLKLHTADNRLLVFARKPAPVQATWLGYPGTTGMRAIDYRFTDPYFDPPDTQALCSEKTIQLPLTYWAYDPLTPHVEVNQLPAQINGIITFGSLNDFKKINHPTLELWARAMKAVPASRLLLLAEEGLPRQFVHKHMHNLGIQPDRIEFASRCPRDKYLELYHRIDIALDTFPCNGHTTSLDSFWMGVPVITLLGPTIMGRVTFSQLMNLHLPEYVTKTPDQFAAVARTLAMDLPLLANLRTELRGKMRKSPLMDGRQFTRNMEIAYRKMWRKWCETSS